MEFTTEHYVIIGFSFAIGFLLAFIFFRVNYVKNLAKLETTVNISDQRQVQLENQLSAKEIELNAIRKQTVDLMQNEANLKNKAKTDHQVLREKEFLLESMKTNILSSVASCAVPVASTTGTSVKEVVNPVGVYNSTLQHLDQKLSDLMSSANTKLDRIAVVQSSISKNTTALLKQDLHVDHSKEMPSMDIDAMKEASIALEKVVFSESDEFIEAAV